MNLKELKEVFEGMDDDTILQYGLGDVFSWRGSYDEVAFSIVTYVPVKSCKELINKAYTETFYGYKGGEYRYFDDTPVNFESSVGSWSDGDYVEDVIARIEHVPYRPDRDKHMINLMVESY